MTQDFKAGNFPVDELSPNFDTGKGFVVPKASPVFAEMSLSFTSLDTVMESQIDLRCVGADSIIAISAKEKHAEPCDVVWSLCLCSSEMAVLIDDIQRTDRSPSRAVFCRQKKLLPSKGRRLPGQWAPKHKRRYYPA